MSTPTETRHEGERAAEQSTGQAIPEGRDLGCYADDTNDPVPGAPPNGFALDTDDEDIPGVCCGMWPVSEDDQTEGTQPTGETPQPAAAAEEQTPC